jgi:hypothetical protein
MTSEPPDQLSVHLNARPRRWPGGSAVTVNWSSNIEQYRSLSVGASFIVTAHDNHPDDHCRQ